MGITMSSVVTHDCGTRLRVPEGAANKKVRCPGCQVVFSPGVRDPYAVLGVPRDASLAQIKSAYRSIARETHPDLTHSTDSAAFREATEAYSLLSDPEQRFDYDASGTVDENAIAAQRDAILEVIQYVRATVAVARRKARNSALVGAAWFTGGASISIGAYFSAEPGERVPVFWGAILFGAIQAVRGFVAASRIRRAGDAMERDMWSELAV